MLALGKRYKTRLEKKLLDLCPDILWLPDNPDIDPRLAGHADLSLFYGGRNTVFVARGIYPYIVNTLTKKYKIIIYKDQGEKYPQDVGLCLCRTREYTIYNPQTVDVETIPYLTGIPVKVRQGYTKCSICVVSEDSIITSDHVISTEATKAGMNVLEISPGYILLDGFNHGFIGGASFLLNTETIVFTGTLDRHPDQMKILDFIQTHGITPLFLTSDPIFDIGGAVILP